MQQRRQRRNFAIFEADQAPKMALISCDSETHSEDSQFTRLRSHSLCHFCHMWNETKKSMSCPIRSERWWRTNEICRRETRNYFGSLRDAQNLLRRRTEKKETNYNNKCITAENWKRKSEKTTFIDQKGDVQFGFCAHVDCQKAFKNSKSL